jgi:hypothetical protein
VAALPDVDEAGAPSPLEAREAAPTTFTDFSKLYSSPAGSAEAGVGWPTRRHRSMKCSCGSLRQLDTGPFLDEAGDGRGIGRG